jgi:hypothetical protein
MREASLMPLIITKNRFYAFVEETARIWADFWISKYEKRFLRVGDSADSYYIPFDANRYKNLILSAKVHVHTGALYSETERLETLLNLFEKGVITKKQLVARLPDGVVSDKKQLLSEIIAEDDVDEGI